MCDQEMRKYNHALLRAIIHASFEKRVIIITRSVSHTAMDPCWFLVSQGVLLLEKATMCLCVQLI
jgi:hypothetical protein